MNTVMITIFEVIEGLVNEYVPQYNTNREHINTGNCVDFAQDLENLGFGVATWGSELSFEHWGPDITEEMWDRYYRYKVVCCHCFTIYEGRYYDSETPEGVEWPDELPCFIRSKEFWG